MLTKPIWFCFATKNNAFTAQKVVDSIVRQIQMFATKRVSLLILDKSDYQQDTLDIPPVYFEEVLYYGNTEITALEEHYGWVYKDAQYAYEQDSVQRARLQLYCAALKHAALLEKAIIWQLDDDMCLGETRQDAYGHVYHTQNRDYCALIRAYHCRYPWVDMGIGFCSHAPPLPLFLYLQNQIQAVAQSSASVPFSHSDWTYHDLHRTTLTMPQTLTVEHLEELLKGKLWRPILTPPERPLKQRPEPHWLRGGNVVFFDYKTLIALPHMGWHYEGWIARRSDMLHAWGLHRLGWRVCAIDLSLIHQRAFQKIDLSQLCQKYMQDVLGAIAFRYVQRNPTEAKQRLQDHRDHLQALLKMSSELSLKEEHTLGGELAQALEETQTTIASIPWDTLEPALITFQQQFEHLLSNYTLP